MLDILERQARVSDGGSAVARSDGLSQAAAQILFLEQSQLDLPLHDNWLTDYERENLVRLHIPKRRRDWRLGRWTAKRAIALALHLDPLSSLTDIEIRAAASGAPDAFHRKSALPFAISLSHTSGIALCTVAARELKHGCDIELVEPRNSIFPADYFTEDEQAFVDNAVAEERDLVVTLFWSAKESTLKAIGTGLRHPTRYVEVSFPDMQGGAAPRELPGSLLGAMTWLPLHTQTGAGESFCGWWREARQLIRTVVIAQP
jgi:4'-phosphopantetheinyl transferase